MRGIPVSPETPKTTAKLGQFERARGPQFRGVAAGFSESAGNAALINARGFIVADQSAGNIGQAVEQEGHAMTALRIKANEAVDIQKEKGADGDMDAEEIEISRAIAAEPDETKWKDIAAKRMNDLSAKVLRNDLSPDARTAINFNLDRWRKRLTAVTDLHSSERSLKKAGKAIEDRLDIAEVRQDPAAFERNLGDYKRFGGITDEGIELRRLKFAETGKRLQLAAKAERFNVTQNLAIARTRALGEEAALRELKDGTLGADLDASDKERVRGAIQQTERGQFADTQASILDAIATGKIQTEAGIDAAAPKTLRPADREFLKNKLRKDFSESAKLEAAKPEVIRERFGRLLDAADKFDAEALGGVSSEEARNAFVSIGLEALLLPEDLRGNITGPLDKKWRGSLELDTSTKSYITEAVQDLYDNGAFGPISKDVKVTRSDNSEVWEKQADVEGQKKARSLHADAMIALNKWVEQNPNATREEATQAIYGLSGHSMRLDDAARILSGANAATTAPAANASPPPGFPSRDIFGTVAGSLGSGFTGGRITSYGYPGDSTPDSNSKVGIGAWVPDAEAEKIRRGESSPFKLKPGDLAVSPDIEAAFERANIQPGDWVTLTYKDGSTHTGRWMDRTAKEYEGKKLTKRFDLYSPGGKSPRDDTPVVSFARSRPTP
ncbi:MAG: hypothetical protein JWM59_1991 [Verrucomicrobiales bacterium]|nr:hypothetical protein [Verrucomicrobiales bacterium]